MKKRKHLISLIAAITAASLTSAAVYAAPPAKLWADDADTAYVAERTHSAASLYADDVRTITDEHTGEVYEIPDGYYPVNGYLMEFDKETGTITRFGQAYAITNDILVIPTEIDGVKVNHIGDNAARYWNWSIEKLVIPDGIESIGKYAFSNPWGDDIYITTLTIPGSVKYIGKGAFSHCDELETVVIENGVEVIGGSAFAYCDALKSVTLPESLKEIGSEAFYECDEIEGLTLPGSLERIGFDAFYRVYNISENENYILWDTDYNDEIPANITCVADGALNELDSINVSADNEKYKSVDGVLYSKDGTELLSYPLGKVESLYGSEENTIVIPDGVKKIGNYAFFYDYYMDEIVNVQLPDTVEIIGESAFEGFVGYIDPGECVETDEDSYYICRLPASLNEIGDNAFEKCIFGEINIPDSVKTIGDAAFYGNSRLVSVTVPDSVDKLGDYAFEGCNRLSEAVVGAKNIGVDAFYPYDGEEQNLKKVTLTDNVEYIGEGAFRDQTNLSELTLGKNIKTIGREAFYNTGIASLVIPDSVEYIDYDAFAECRNLTEAVIGAKRIGDSAFAPYYDYDADDIEKGLTQVTFTDNVEYIGTGAFSGTKITNLVLPDSVERIEWGAFAECRSLSELTLGKNIKYIGQGAFYGTTIAELVIPDSVETIDWQAFGATQIEQVNIPAGVKWLYSPFVYCENLKTITVDEENQNFKVTDGVLFTADGSDLIQYPPKREGTEYTVPQGVKYIGSFAGSELLEKINIPDTVTDIGSNAFSSCTALTEMIIPDSVDYVGSSAFSGCTALKSVRLPEKLEMINGSIFSGCEALETVNIPDTVTEIGGGAFRNCKSIKNIKLPDNLVRIRNRAFMGCTSLEKINIPSGVERIYSYAFEGCESLAEVYIPETVNIIDSQAFQNCSPELVIYGYEGTFAQKYAEKYSIEFAPIPQAVSAQAVRGSDSGTITVTLTPPESGDEAITIPDSAIIVMKNGANLISAQELSGTGGVFTAQDADGASYIKVFFWNSLEGMQPIDDMEPVIIGIK